jgi:hypothetical protein
MQVPFASSSIASFFYIFHINETTPSASISTVVSNSLEILPDRILGLDLFHLCIFELFTASKAHLKLVDSTDLLQQTTDLLILGGRIFNRGRRSGSRGRSRLGSTVTVDGTVLAATVAAAVWARTSWGVGRGSVIGSLLLGLLGSFALLLVLGGRLGQVLGGQSNAATRCGSRRKVFLDGLGTGDLTAARLAKTVHAGAGNAFADKGSTTLVFTLEGERG